MLLKSSPQNLSQRGKALGQYRSVNSPKRSLVILATFFSVVIVACYQLVIAALVVIAAVIVVVIVASSVHLQSVE